MKPRWRPITRLSEWIHYKVSKVVSARAKRRWEMWE